MQRHVDREQQCVFNIERNKKKNKSFIFRLVRRKNGTGRSKKTITLMTHVDRVTFKDFSLFQHFIGCDFSFSTLDMQHLFTQKEISKRISQNNFLSSSKP